MENKENKPVYNPDRYKYAAAGAHFLQAKDTGSAKKCLEKLASDWNLTEDQKAGLVWNAFSGDPKSEDMGIAKGIEVYAGKYKVEMEKMSISQMFDRYSPEFSKIGEDRKAVAQSVFDKLGTKNYGSILDEVAKLKEIMESKTKRWSKEDKEKAEKEYVEKYADVHETIQAFENLRINKLIAPIQEESIYSNIKEIFQPKEKEKKA